MPKKEQKTCSSYIYHFVFSNQFWKIYIYWLALTPKFVLKGVLYKDSSGCICSCCSVTKSCLTLCDLIDYSAPDSSILHYLLEFAQILIHWVGEANPTISSFVAAFSSYPQSFPATGSSPMSGLFTSGGQSIGASALASVLPMNIQD